MELRKLSNSENYYCSYSVRGYGNRSVIGSLGTVLTSAVDSNADCVESIEIKAVEDSRLLKIQRFQAIEIARLFGVPAHLL